MNCSNLVRPRPRPHDFLPSISCTIHQQFTSNGTDQGMGHKSYLLGNINPQKPANLLVTRIQQELRQLREEKASSSTGHCQSLSNLPFAHHLIPKQILCFLFPSLIHTELGCGARFGQRQDFVKGSAKAVTSMAWVAAYYPHPSSRPVCGGSSWELFFKFLNHERILPPPLLSIIPLFQCSANIPSPPIPPSSVCYYHCSWLIPGVWGALQPLLP